MDTDRQEYTIDGLQEGVNYSFTVTQTGFSGGGVLSTGPVYARTFRAGNYSNLTECSDKQTNFQTNKTAKTGCFNHTVITWLHADKLMSILTRASLLYRDKYKTIYDMYINNRDLNTMTISVKTSIVSTTWNSEPNKQHALCSVCIHNINCADEPWSSCDSGEL